MTSCRLSCRVGEMSGFCCILFHPFSVSLVAVGCCLDFFAPTNRFDFAWLDIRNRPVDQKNKAEMFADAPRKMQIVELIGESLRLRLLFRSVMTADTSETIECCETFWTTCRRVFCTAFALNCATVIASVASVAWSPLPSPSLCFTDRRRERCCRSALRVIIGIQRQSHRDLFL